MTEQAFFSGGGSTHKADLFLTTGRVVLCQANDVALFGWVHAGLAGRGSWKPKSYSCLPGSGAQSRPRTRHLPAAGRKDGWNACLFKSGSLSWLKRARAKAQAQAAHESPPRASPVAGGSGAAEWGPDLGVRESGGFRSFVTAGESGGTWTWRSPARIYEDFLICS